MSRDEQHIIMCQWSKGGEEEDKEAVEESLAGWSYTARLKRCIRH